MARPHRLAALALAGAAPFAGLAQASAPVHGPRTLPATDCAQLAAETTRIEAARRSAVEEGDKAWKAIVPFVVLARKASSKAAVDEADRRLADLSAQSQRQGCGAGPQ